MWAGLKECRKGVGWHEGTTGSAEPGSPAGSNQPERRRDCTDTLKDAV